MNKIFSSSPLWQAEGLFLIRIIVGFFMIYHGCEVFSEEKMKPYFEWDVFKKFSSPALIVYTGKIAELVAGILLVIGLFTRAASLVLIFTMLYISFFVGHGKVWYDDQHPFLFVLLGLVFFFTGGGKWSVDQLLTNSKK
ncbi:MAG: DoxX family protein [Chitinophagaceae bacterium]